MGNEVAGEKIGREVDWRVAAAEAYRNNDKITVAQWK
jgi:hypothetical protein